VCAKCGLEKPSADFPVNRYCHDGLAKCCRACKPPELPSARTRKRRAPPGAGVGDPDEAPPDLREDSAALGEAVTDLGAAAIELGEPPPGGAAGAAAVELGESAGVDDVGSGAPSAGISPGAAAAATLMPPPPHTAADAGTGLTEAALTGVVALGEESIGEGFGAAM
jgi:hypothetical protein